MSTDTKSWPELAIGLYDALNERNAEINYEFDNMEIYVPSSTKDDAEHAKWKVHGKLTVYTNERKEK